MNTARFIVLEGVDGAGTTTQTELLRARLRRAAAPALSTHEPTSGPIGVMLRQALSRRLTLPPHAGLSEPLTRETLALLFAADRLDHVAAQIAPALRRGEHVISDRYLLSSYAYQGDIEPPQQGAPGQAEQVDYTWIEQLNARALKPDLTIVLRVDLDTSLRRLEARGGLSDLYETREKLERLIARYDELTARALERGERLVTLDGTEPVEQVHERVWRAFQAL